MINKLQLRVCFGSKPLVHKFGHIKFWLTKSKQLLDVPHFNIHTFDVAKL